MRRTILWIVALAGMIYCGGCPPAHAQVPVSLAPVATQQFFNGAGVPLASGCLFTYSAGTSTPLATYTDSSGNFQNSNPLILTGGGFAPSGIWLSANAYKFVMFSAGGVNCASGQQQWAIDFINPAPNLSGSNAWTGPETHGGTETFNAPVVINSTLTVNGLFSGVISLNSPIINGTPSGNGIARLSMFRGSALGDYTIAANIVTDVDAGNLAFTVNVPINWKALIVFTGGCFNLTNASGTILIADGTTALATVTQSNTPTAQSCAIQYLFTGDGNLHTFKMRFANGGAGTFTIKNDSSAIAPIMTLFLTPSN